jgi:hypothetical protein
LYFFLSYPLQSLFLLIELSLGSCLSLSKGYLSSLLL